MTMRLRTRALLLSLAPFALLLAAIVALETERPMASHALLYAALAAAALTGTCAVVIARSLERSLAGLAGTLREAEQTGELAAMNEPHSILPELQELARAYHQAAAAVRGTQERRRHAYVESVGALAVALDARDPTTAGHSWRVSESACAVGQALGLTAQQLERLRVSAVVHDIGKIEVSDAILRKDGPLTDSETAMVQRHPRVGRRILERVHGFTEFLDAVEQHHENWDGTGYPQGLQGEETCVEARIIRVADAYDAMTTDRCYRKGMTHEVAIRILWGCSGTQFDPAVVRQFAALPQEALERMRAAADVGLAGAA